MADKNSANNIMTIISRIRQIVAVELFRIFQTLNFNKFVTFFSRLCRSLKLHIFRI